MRLNRYIFKNAIVIALLLAFNANAAAPTYNIQLGLSNENFEGNSELFNQLTAAVKYSKGLSRNSGISLNADIFTSQSHDINDHNSNGVLAELIYTFIPSGGYSKPVYSVALRQQWSTSETIEKDYSKTSLILADTIRFDDQLTITGGVELIKQSFDNDDRTIYGLFINTDLQANDNLIIYFNIKYQDERSDSSPGLISDIDIDRIAVRDEIAGGHLESEIPHVNPSLPDAGSSSITSTNTKNTLITLGSNYKINSHHSIDISYEQTNYAFSGNTDIDAKIISLDYFYKF